MLNNEYSNITYISILSLSLPNLSNSCSYQSHSHVNPRLRALSPSQRPSLFPFPLPPPLLRPYHFPTIVRRVCETDLRRPLAAILNIYSQVRRAVNRISLLRIPRKSRLHTTVFSWLCEVVIGAVCFGRRRVQRE